MDTRVFAILAAILVLFKVIDAGSGRERHPQFTDQIDDVMVKEGDSAIFHCHVAHLGDKFKVVWLYRDTQTILTYGTGVITDDKRISVGHSARQIWTLQIRDVTEDDAGVYRCEVNTDPRTYVEAMLNVQIPPHFISSENTQSEIEVMEGANVTMECEARGLPTPNITWRRDDDKKLSLARPAVSAGGKRIELYNVQRMDAGSYNCIASNRVPPPRSRSIMLRVQYSPSIMPSPSPLQGVVLDRNVTMKCHTEAYPAVTDGQWFKDNIAIGDITDRYLPIIRPRSGSTAVTLELFIINVRKEDTGEYSCKASNIVGSVEARIDIDEVLPPPPTTTTELPSTAPKAGGTKGREHRKDRNKDRKGDNEDVDSEDMVQNTDLFSSISQDGRTAKDDASANDQTKTPIHVNESKDKATVGNKASFAHRCSVVLRLFCCAVIVFLSSLWDELT